MSENLKQILGTIAGVVIFYTSYKLSGFESTCILALGLIWAGTINLHSRLEKRKNHIYISEKSFLNKKGEMRDHEDNYFLENSILAIMANGKASINEIHLELLKIGFNINQPTLVIVLCDMENKGYTVELSDLSI